MKKFIFAVTILLAFCNIFADEVLDNSKNINSETTETSTTTENNTTETSTTTENNPKTEQEILEAKKVEEIKSILKWGVESQVIKIVSQLKENKKAGFSSEIENIYINTGNTKLKVLILDYFTAIENSCLYDDCIEKLKTYDNYNTEYMKAILNYVEKFIKNATEEEKKIFLDIILYGRDFAAQQTVKLIGNKKLENFSTKLYELFNDYAYKTSVKPEILKTLGKLNYLEAEEKIVETALSETKSKDFRFAAIDSLGEIGNDKAIKTLKKLLTNKDSYIRNRSLNALYNIKNINIDEIILSALKDNYWKIRMNALDKIENENLKQFEDVVLFKAKYDPEKNIQNKSIKVLGVIGGEKSEKYLVESFLNGGFSLKKRKLCLKSMKKFGYKNYVNKFTKIIEKEMRRDSRNRKLLDTIAFELTKIKEPELAPIYMQLLNSNIGLYQYYAMEGIKLNNLKIGRDEITKLSNIGNNNRLRNNKLKNLAKEILEKDKESQEVLE